MTKDSDGVWTFTTPLPSGTFSYGFFVDCASDAGTGCTRLSDPAQKPWNESTGTVQGGRQTQSQVYVPNDLSFDPDDNSWQAPVADPAQRGALASVSYPSPGHLTPAGFNYLAVYTPPGYDPTRAAKYPTLYVSHGGGGNETDWTTQGDLANIADNLIASGALEPTVIVSISFQGWQNTCAVGVDWETDVENDVINNVIPYVESHYDVAAQQDRRAFAGLSCGGSLTHAMLQDHTSTFGYYGILSPGGGRLMSPITEAKAAQYRQLGLYVGGGFEEPTTFSTATGPRVNAVNDMTYFAQADVPVTSKFINGIHGWATWRPLALDFLTRVAFKPVAGRTVALSGAPGISGGPVTVGQALHAQLPTTSTDGVTWSYQWLRSGAPITGATGASYTPGAADLGQAISVRLTAAKAGYTSVTVESARTSPVSAGTIHIAKRAALKGVPTVGHELRVVLPRTDVSGTSAVVRWYRDGHRVRGAAGRHYRIEKSDRGSRIKATVTVTEAAYAPAVSTTRAAKVRD